MQKQVLPRFGDAPLRAIINGGVRQWVGCNVREVSEWAGRNGVAFTLSRDGGLFEDGADAAVEQLDAFSRADRWSLVGQPSAS
jgi:hypothetical protein